MISDLDEHVGAILQRLEKHGLVENTVVIFTSDNGTTHGSRDPKFGVGGVELGSLGLLPPATSRSSRKVSASVSARLGFDPVSVGPIKMPVLLSTPSSKVSPSLSGLVGSVPVSLALTKAALAKPRSHARCWTILRARMF